MAVKRTLKRFRLDKIAAVDRPCQEHATVAIIKRAPAAPALTFAKANFADALNGAMVSEKVNEAFWRSFDGLWQRNDAFRTALTDELSDGGDGSAASADYIASVNSLVEEAVAAARSAGSTASDADMEKAITEAATSWIAKKQPQSKEQNMNITTKALLKSAVASFDPSTSPASQIAIIQKAATDLDALGELPAEGLLAVQKADPAVAAMQTEITVLKMAPDIQKHYQGLAEAAQPAFIAKSADDQRAEVDAANATDPVLYKSAAGIDIRKSDGAVALMMAKRLDEQDAEIIKLRSGQTESAIEKRAQSFSNVAATIAVDMLKSVDQLGADTPAAKSIMKSLEAMNKSQTTLFKNLGTLEGGEGPGDIQKARSDFNTEVSKIASRDKLAPADAMSKARQELPELFAEAYPSPIAEDA